jgi:hypothetical protein
VVWVGVTVALPLGGTAPTPLLIVAVTAFVVVQVKVTLAPIVIDAGDADRVTVGAAGGAANPTQPVNTTLVKLKHSNSK